MNQKLFDDIPGVGEILIYQIDEKIGEKKHWLEQRNNNLWLDSLAIAQIKQKDYVTFSCLKGSINDEAVKQLLFLDNKNGRIGFKNEKYLIAALLIIIYEAIININDLPELDFLMPYDYINYLRPVIQKDDSKLLIKNIENSKNKLYIRTLFLLLRRCGVEGNKDWGVWLQKYIDNLPSQIKSYEDFMVYRDALVTYTSILGKEVLYPFVNKIISDKSLKEFEKRHFIESLGTPERAGEVLYWKIVEAGYRQEIAPINIFALSFFPTPKRIKLLERISKENDYCKIREIAKKALQNINNSVSKKHNE